MRPIVIAFALLAATSAFADTMDNLRACSKLTDDKARLACFDSNARLWSSPPVPTAAAPDGQIEVVDVLADFKTLRGKSVEVGGMLLTMGSSAILYIGRGSTTGIFVDIESLSSDQRRQIYKECGSGCDVVVQGNVATVMLNPGLSAKRITLK